MQLHPTIVSRLTDHLQVGLRLGQYATEMASTRELLTPADRVDWAIKQLKLNGVTLEELGERVGCSHSALSQWRKGETQIENVKAHLLEAFARETGVSVGWILHGGPVRVDAYTSSDRVAELTRKLTAMEEFDPAKLDLVGRMIDAAAETPPAPPPPSPTARR